MKGRWLLTANVLFLATITAFGQQDHKQPEKAVGYLFAAPGALVGDGLGGTLHFGGGGEKLLKGNLGLTGELGYLARATHPGQGMGVLSTGMFYQFKRGRKTAPFVTGGYSLAFRSGVFHFIHFGGGVNHWFSERWGLRIEGRDHIDPRVPEYHFLQIRLAILIR